MIFYQNNRTIKIKDKQYLKKMGKKNKEVELYVFKPLKEISDSDFENLNLEEYIWKSGDTLGKLASIKYGDVRMWRILAWINNKYIDQNIEVGTVIYIPVNVEQILELYFRG